LKGLLTLTAPTNTAYQQLLIELFEERSFYQRNFYNQLSDEKKISFLLTKKLKKFQKIILKRL